MKPIICGWKMKLQAKNTMCKVISTYSSLPLNKRGSSEDNIPIQRKRIFEHISKREDVHFIKETTDAKKRLCRAHNIPLHDNSAADQCGQAKNNIILAVY